MQVTYLVNPISFAHTIRALELSRNWRCPNHPLLFVSGGSSADFLAKAGARVLRVGLCDNNSVDPMEATTVVLGAAAGELIVVDEIPAVARITEALGKPMTYVTDSFGADRGAPEEDSYLVGIKEIVLADWKRLHSIPEAIGTRVIEIGPILRQPSGDRERLSRALFSCGALMPEKLSEVRMLWQMACEVVSSSPSVQLNVFGQREAFEEYLEQPVPADVVFRSEDSDIREVLETAQIGFTAGGTSVVESALFGVPTLAIQTPRGFKVEEARFREVISLCDSVFAYQPGREEDALLWSREVLTGSVLRRPSATLGLEDVVSRGSVQSLERLLHDKAASPRCADQ